MFLKAFLLTVCIWLVAVSEQFPIHWDEAGRKAKTLLATVHPP
jgi:hypothetical protein